MKLADCRFAILVFEVQLDEETTGLDGCWTNDDEILEFDDCSGSSEEAFCNSDMASDAGKIKAKAW